MQAKSTRLFRLIEESHNFLYAGITARTFFHVVRQQREALVGGFLSLSHNSLGICPHLLVIQRFYFIMDSHEARQYIADRGFERAGLFLSLLLRKKQYHESG